VALTADPGPFYPAPASTQGFDERGFTTPGIEDVTLGSDAPPSALGAAFRQSNPTASLLSSEDVQNTVDPAFDSKTRFDELVKDPKYLPHIDLFTDVHNDKAWDAKKRQIDQETADRKALDALPWYQRIPLEILAGSVDPTIAIPGATVVRGVKGGVAIARTAAATGLATGGAVAVQEGALHGTQELRTAEESAVTIGGSIILGAALGAGASKLLSRAEHAAFSKALDED
jgi:hypothetical protein